MANIILNGASGKNLLNFCIDNNSTVFVHLATLQEKQGKNLNIWSQITVLLHSIAFANLVWLSVQWQVLPAFQKLCQKQQLMHWRIEWLRAWITAWFPPGLSCNSQVCIMVTFFWNVNKPWVICIPPNRTNVSLMSFSHLDWLFQPRNIWKISREIAVGLLASNENKVWATPLLMKCLCVCELPC